MEMKNNKRESTFEEQYMHFNKMLAEATFEKIVMLTEKQDKPNKDMEMQAEYVFTVRRPFRKIDKHLTAAERIFKQRYGRPAGIDDAEEIYNLSELLKDIYGKEETDNDKR